MKDTFARPEGQSWIRNKPEKYVALKLIDEISAKPEGYRINSAKCVLTHLHARRSQIVALQNFDFNSIGRPYPF